MHGMCQVEDGCASRAKSLSEKGHCLDARTPAGDGTREWSLFRPLAGAGSHSGPRAGAGAFRSRVRQSRRLLCSRCATDYGCRRSSGRLIPSLTILDRSVLGLMPSRLAALPSPLTFQPDSSRARRMVERSTELRSCFSELDGLPTSRPADQPASRLVGKAQRLVHDEGVTRAEYPGALDDVPELANVAGQS